MSVRILVGNALDVLAGLGAGSVHCSVTSPPYYGLRKYDGDQAVEWPAVEYAPMAGLAAVQVEAMTCALGHEPTIEAYVGHLVAVYREVRRVLRDDGVAWVVMGDSFSGGGGYYPNAPSNLAGSLQAKRNKPTGERNIKGKRLQSNLKQGDLMLIPHRLALALQADGWLLRNDVVWAKKAPMPESVAGWRWMRHRVKIAKGKYLRQGMCEQGFVQTPQNEPHNAAQWADCPGCPKCEPDGYVLRKGSWRHTRAQEYIFHLSKGMQYWSDQEAVREAVLHPNAKGTYGTSHEHAANPQFSHSGRSYDGAKQSGRNPRSVLSPKPEPSGLAHFAIFPTSLITPLIKATCPTRCCPICGAGWSAVVEHIRRSLSDTFNPKHLHGKTSGLSNPGWRKREMPRACTNILGYRPSCGCGHDDHVPGTVLDPFVGAGTTLLVADRLGLNAIGIDISEHYVMELAKPRVEGDAPLLVRVQVLV